MNYNWSDKTILIAEDIDANFLFLEKILQDTRVKIIRAINGKEAIDIYKNNQNIDLILMDIRMPEIDGFDATKEIKKINNNVPIVVETAYNIENGKKMGKESGCDDYIVKPININKLIAVINKFI
ncbi:MAG: response regulator [Bacteroidetes bacterium]|nr:MAG: response regulator [Bacteroidota bacterium]